MEKYLLGISTVATKMTFMITVVSCAKKVQTASISKDSARAKKSAKISNNFRV